MNDPGTDPLLLGLAAGREEAFAALYDRFAARLYRTALRTLGRPEDAEDTVQEVFMAVVRSRRKLHEVRDLSAYLFAALRRAARRRRARRAREPMASDLAMDVVAKEDRQRPDNPHRERLARALAALPVEQRETIALKIDGELTFAQIGQVMGVSVNTAASRYRYALEKLRVALQTVDPARAPKE